MVNKLCNMCAKTCKQSDSIKIVSCPKFMEKPTEKEFRDMINELDEAEKNVKKLQKNVRIIIKNTLSENSPEPKDSKETEIKEETD